MRDAETVVRSVRREPFARRESLTVAAVILVGLVAMSGRYGFHRDELYFCMLPPARGYLDQPPFVPLLASQLCGSPLLLRVPAALSAAGSVLVVTALSRELGASRSAQSFVAFAYAGTLAVLGFGHLLLTSSLDLLLWPTIMWCIASALRRVDQATWWWAAAGIITGLATYNKLLVAVVPVAVLASLGATRAGALRTRGPWLAGSLALVLAVPNIQYQYAHDWPQFAMGSALSAENSGEVRWFMWVFLIVALGPVLVPVWWRGLLRLARSAELRPLAASFALLVAMTFVSGAQPHYPMFMLSTLLAAGAQSLGPSVASGWWLAAAANGITSAVMALPILPIAVLAQTPITTANQLTADQIGWPEYAAQVQAEWQALPFEERENAIVLATNYGEAGALTRYTNLPVVSGHNALWELAQPPATVRTVLFVGEQMEVARTHFASCSVVTYLDHGLGTDNEEQGAPVAVCREPLEAWDRLWPRLQHLS